MGEVRSKEEIEKCLKWLDDTVGLRGIDEELATKDLEAGIACEHIQRYCGKKLDDKAKVIYSDLLRKGHTPTEIEKYLYPMIDEGKLETHYKLSLEGKDVMDIDMQSNRDAFNRLSEFQEKGKSVLKNKTETPSEEVKVEKEEPKEDSDKTDIVEEKDTPAVTSNQGTAVYYNGLSFDQVKDLFGILAENAYKKENPEPVTTPKANAEELELLKNMPVIIAEIVSKTVEQTMRQVREEVNSSKKDSQKAGDEHSDNASVDTIRSNTVKEDDSVSKEISSRKEMSGNIAKDNLIFMADFSNKRNSCSFPIEIEKKKSSGLGGIVANLGFKKRYQRSLVRMAIAGELDKMQLRHIATAIKSGLSESQLSDLIESRVPAERMPELIEIAVLEKRMGYAG